MGIMGIHPDDTHDNTLRKVAWIREDECIGCVKCVQACPVDAIVGAAKQIHTVISNDCIGCDLCVPACPVDCIEMHPLVDQQFDPMAADNARRRAAARTMRLAQNNRQPHSHGKARTSPAANNTQYPTDNIHHLNLKKLQATAAMTKKQHKEAVQALARAQRAGYNGIAAMQARVETLQQKADAAQQALAAAMPQQQSSGI